MLVVPPFIRATSRMKTKPSHRLLPSFALRRLVGHQQYGALIREVNPWSTLEAVNVLVFASYEQRKRVAGAAAKVDLKYLVDLSTGRSQVTFYRPTDDTYVMLMLWLLNASH
jgi:hypothetical protein